MLPPGSSTVVINISLIFLALQKGHRNRPLFDADRPFLEKASLIGKIYFIFPRRAAFLVTAILAHHFSQLVSR